MKSLFIIFGLLTCGAAAAHGDKNLLSTQAREDVMKPIRRFLDALQKGDSAMLNNLSSQRTGFPNCGVMILSFS